MSLQLKNINFKINSVWQNLLNLSKPIGFCYISLTSEDPANIYGGTWTQKSITNNSPYLLTNNPENLGIFSSGSYNYNCTFNWNVSSIGLTAAQIGRKTTIKASGSATVSHGHVNWLPGDSTEHVMQGSTSPKWYMMRGTTDSTSVTVTKGDSSGNYKIRVGRSTNQTAANNTMTTNSMYHRHTRSTTYYSTNVTYNGTHTHSVPSSFEGSSLSLSKIPYYQRVYFWVRTS